MTTPEQVQAAREFHEAYERLAPTFGYETRIGTREFDPDSPNGRLMVAVCAEVITEREQAARAEGYAAGVETALKAFLTAYNDAGPKASEDDAVEAGFRAIRALLPGGEK